MRKTIISFMVVAMLATSSLAALAYTLDLETGEGFVGKGEVQTAFGWNNRQLQQNAEDVSFEYENTIVTEVSWICTNSHNDNVQERERTTITSVSGVLDSVTRDRNQVTGFILEGYDGNPISGTPVTDGEQLNSCPNGRDWSLTTSAGDPEVVSSSGGLYVIYDGTRHLLP